MQAYRVAIAKHEIDAAIELQAINDRPEDKGPIYIPNNLSRDLGFLKN